MPLNSRKPASTHRGTSSVEDLDVRVAIAPEQLCGAGCVGHGFVAEHHPCVPPRHQLRRTQFEARKRCRRREQQVASGEFSFLTHVEQRQFAPILQHCGEFTRSNPCGEVAHRF